MTAAFSIKCMGRIDKVVRKTYENAAQTEKHLAGIRTRDGVCGPLSEPACADPALGYVSESIVSQLATVLAHRELASCGGFLSAQLRRVRNRRKYQSVLWTNRGLGARALQLSRQAPVGFAGGFAIRASDRGRGHRTDHHLRTEWMDWPISGAAGNQVGVLATRRRYRAHVYRASLRGAHGAAST